MPKRFNPPPGWPQPPKGWLPPPGWQPNPSWPPAPPRWIFVRQTRGVPRWAKRLGITALILGVPTAYGFVSAYAEKSRAPEVGECARANFDDESIELIDCDHSDADYVVTSRVSDSSDGHLACAADQEATSYFSYQASGRLGETGAFVVCLRDR